METTAIVLIVILIIRLKTVSYDCSALFLKYNKWSIVWCWPMQEINISSLRRNKGWTMRIRVNIRFLSLLYLGLHFFLDIMLSHWCNISILVQKFEFDEIYSIIEFEIFRQKWDCLELYLLNKNWDFASVCSEIVVHTVVKYIFLFKNIFSIFPILARKFKFNVLSKLNFWTKIEILHQCVVMAKIKQIFSRINHFESKW